MTWVQLGNKHIGTAVPSLAQSCKESGEEKHTRTGKPTLETLSHWPPGYLSYTAI